MRVNGLELYVAASDGTWIAHCNPCGRYQRAGGEATPTLASRERGAAERFAADHVHPAEVDDLIEREVSAYNAVVDQTFGMEYCDPGCGMLARHGIVHTVACYERSTGSEWVRPSSWMVDAPKTP